MRIPRLNGHLRALPRFGGESPCRTLRCANLRRGDGYRCGVQICLHVAHLASRIQQIRGDPRLAD
jgi:hypothetical protein